MVAWDQPTGRDVTGGRQEDGKEKVSGKSSQDQAGTKIPIVGHEHHHQHLADIVGEGVQDRSG